VKGKEMKKIRLRGESITSSGERITSLSILRLVAMNSPGRAIGVDEMRKRVRILDALESLPRDAEYLLLEDDDANMLSDAIGMFPWSSASKSLLNIIDDVLRSEVAPVKLVEGGKSAK
jgi:hypothetical protein